MKFFCSLRATDVASINNLSNDKKVISDFKNQLHPRFPIHPFVA